MKNKLFAVLGAVAFLAVAFAALEGGGEAEAAQPRTTAISHVSPERFTNLIVEPKGVCSVDFPSLNPKQQNLTAPCAESSTCTASGALIGDGCFASSDMSSDGGAALVLEAQLTCRAVLNGVVFKLCVNFTDGGTYDAPASNFTGRIIH